MRSGRSEGSGVPFEVVVPQIGEAVSELRLASWLKKVGERVTVGDPLFEVDSDKAVVEVESVVDGTLAEILAEVDASVMPQQVVARILADDEVSTPGSDRPRAAAGPVDGRDRAADAVPATQPNARAREGARARPAERASPKARRHARELGVSLEGIEGTGPHGLITVSDIDRAARRRGEAATSVPQHAPHEPGSFSDLPKLRQVVARRMLASKQLVPHFYLSVDVDTHLLAALRDYCRQALAWERPPSYTDIVVRACALTLAEMPELNVSYTDRLFRRDAIGIGLAVATDQGLTVPVLADADTLTLRDVATALRELAQRARAGRLKQSDTGAKSMVVSNLGMYGVDSFAAIIDMPDPMILSMGRVRDCLVPVAGSPAVRPMATLGLSVDHRVLDGVQGAQFLARLKHRLEQPFEILGSERS
jgi:pyruvate dehydrogenase E2 component (dihydrolipoamide acetyltransferase)